LLSLLLVRKGPTSHLPLHDYYYYYYDDDRHHRDPTNRNPWQDLYCEMLSSKFIACIAATLLARFAVEGLASLPVVDMRSDTVTTPNAGMRKAIATAAVGDDVFGKTRV
jgi:hypothetical protein